MQEHSQEKSVIGRSELIHFMDFNIADVPAKVDSGAYRSSVHASNIELSDDGAKLSFTIFGDHPVFHAVSQRITVDSFSRVKVTNSFGHGEERYEINLGVRIASREFTASFTLADRSKMVFPVLLGRKLLNRRFIIDTMHSGVDRLELKRRYKIDIPSDEENNYEDTDSF
jgi:hypothetical protein